MQENSRTGEHGRQIKISQQSFQKQSLQNLKSLQPIQIHLF